MSPKGPPSIFSINLQKNGCSKNRKAPPTFTFFGTMRLTGDFKKNSEKNFGKFLPYAGTVEDNI